MPILAFILVVLSAFMHAIWNYLAKQSQGGSIFVWLYMAVSTVVYFPFAAGYFFLYEVHMGWVELGFILGSAVIHLVYALTLQRGYKVGDLSVIYPLARGSAPLLIAVAAFLIYDERLSFPGIMGIALIVASVFILTGDVRNFKRTNGVKPIAYGLMIGIFIAGYTLWDKGAVSTFFIPPLLLNYGTFLGQFLFLTPFAWKNRGKIKEEWEMNRMKAAGVGILNPLAYILVLTTMKFAPVSYVAPVREISILIGTVMGAKMLTENAGIRRYIAAVIMVIGVMSIAFSK